MKLYDFEKYYIALFKFKVYSLIVKILRNKYASVVLYLVLFLIIYSITAMLIVYFVIGVNSALDKFNLGKYKIESFQMLNTKVNMKDFYNK